MSLRRKLREADDITLSPTVPNETPLPTALPMFLGGAGLIGLLARRRKRNLSGRFALIIGGTMSRALLCSSARRCTGLGWRCCLEQACRVQRLSMLKQTSRRAFLAFANNLDPDLVNPTGMAFGPTSPIWIANQDAGTANLLQGDGRLCIFQLRRHSGSGFADGCSLQSQ